ncbi:Ribonuclease R [Candidatus Arthromitus sp. SFB-5]|nr:Ribonuclease R [Candidatus Arthromitus sp. SFB-5]
MILKKLEFMKDKIGEEYAGIISSLTSFGFFVDLPNTVRGLVHINDMEDDDYYFDEESISLIGRENKNVFKIGMKVQVKVLNVILENNEIYFGLSR